MRSWYPTLSYSAKRYAIMSHTQMNVKPRFQSNIPARNVLVTDSVISFFPAQSRFTHSLCSLHASKWSRLILPELTLVDPARMMSGPGSGDVRNSVPGVIVLYTASYTSPLRYPYVPPPLLDGIDV